MKINTVILVVIFIVLMINLVVSLKLIGQQMKIGEIREDIEALYVKMDNPVNWYRKIISKNESNAQDICQRLHEYNISVKNLINNRERDSLLILEEGDSLSLEEKVDIMACTTWFNLSKYKETVPDWDKWKKSMGME